MALKKSKPKAKAEPKPPVEESAEVAADRDVPDDEVGEGHGPYGFIGGPE